ncbi:MAG: (d)CMP kinase [Bacteroidales bacterium]|nr:(d)CMP kinase [Bacteroidales bacterium]
MKNSTKTLTIAIDGFSSCGKSTFAKRIARELDFLYIDSGAMYRAITLWALENDAITDGMPDSEKILCNLDGLNIGFRPEGTSPETHLIMNGEDVEEKIRTMQVSSLVSPVSKISQVRFKMVELQRKLSENLSVVMDGRDIGTVVFPDADIKIFMTADPLIRAERRFKELQAKGIEIAYEEVLKNVNERDHIDQNREISPLKKADDALVLDNSHLTPDEQMVWFYETFKEVLK